MANKTLTIVQFETPLSLREAVLFVLGELPKAGYTLGRGDAEVNQADAPFARAGMFGQIRINGTAACNTTWLVAVGAAQNSSATSPLLPAPSNSPSPLPFGP